MYPAGTAPRDTSATALGKPDERPLLDFTLPFPHLIPYPQYTFKEACAASGFKPDKLRAELRGGHYGPINEYPSQRRRPKRKNYITMMVPYDTMLTLMRQMPEHLATLKANAEARAQ